MFKYILKRIGLALLILLGVDSFLTEAFKGAIVVISVLMQRKEKLN